jgi:pyridoxal phosphate enzyme (YggS family)
MHKTAQTPIAERVSAIENLVVNTAKACGRQAAAIQILAVSKGQPEPAIREAYTAGLSNFGESYWQEAEKKIQNLADLKINWHFIGPIQSNKAQAIAQHFSWVHSLGREKIAKALSDARPESLPALNLCVQVNLDEEGSKSGVLAQELSQLLVTVTKLPRLKLRGLMAIPKPLEEEQAQFESLLRLAKLFTQLNTKYRLRMDTLSMGMSDDIVAAIRAGSTILRVGRGIFGER